MLVFYLTILDEKYIAIKRLNIWQPRYYLIICKMADQQRSVFTMAVSELGLIMTQI